MDPRVKPAGDAVTFPVDLNHVCAVVARLVPATPIVEAQCHNNRDGRDKRGHDGAGKCFDMNGIRSKTQIY
jgi:hypothetical protein